MSGSSRRIRWRSSPCPSVQSLWFATQFPGGASRLAALLLAQILPVSSLVAPCDPGAAPGTYATIHWEGTLDDDFERGPAGLARSPPPRRVRIGSRLITLVLR